MDAQLARTLGELERKLSALERTLGTIAPAAPSRQPPNPPPLALQPPRPGPPPIAPEAGGHPAGATGNAAAGPPGVEDLLRFRERLERAARELTHEYDELLGRLSYP